MRRSGYLAFLLLFLCVTFVPFMISSLLSPFLASHINFDYPGAYPASDIYRAETLLAATRNSYMSGGTRCSLSLPPTPPPPDIPQIQVTVDNAILRRGPGLSFQPSCVIHRGDRFVVVAQSTANEDGNWYLIYLSDGEAAWTSADHVELSPPEANIPIATSVPIPTSTVDPTSE
jgi:hypothetical protein